jgi:pimeloyl-ACP methyl ester carboxylesterase
MTDYLLVHGAGQGAWSWGGVWGYLTAPEEHPPRLYAARRAERVYCLDLPGHGGDANAQTSQVTLEDCVSAITGAVERQGLRNLVLVGHGFAAPLVLQAASQLPEPPKQVVLIAGIIPREHQNMLAVFPRRSKVAFQLLSKLSKLSRQEFKLPRPIISGYLCNDIDPMEVVHIVGRFGPLPLRVLRTKITLGESQGRCPIAYIVLKQDKILPLEVQWRMAGRVRRPGFEMVELDSCHQAMLHRPRELADILLRYA